MNPSGLCLLLQEEVGQGSNQSSDKEKYNPNYLSVVTEFLELLPFYEVDKQPNPKKEAC